MDDQTGRSFGDMKGDVRPRRRRRASWLLWLLGIALLGIGLWYGWQVLQRTQRPAAPARTPPQAVGAATAEPHDIRVLLSALGTVTSLNTVTVKTQIPGKITQIGFTEGQIVKQGDFLAQIDPRPYQVALETAQGALARDQAQLKNAQLDLGRYRTLVAQDSASRQQLDTQAALVRQYEGTIKVDQAAVSNAQLNLTYCHIVAPIGGRVGLRLVDLGNYVQPSDATGLVVIAQFQPISVVFALPEDAIPAVTKQLNAGRSLAVEAWDRAEQNKLEDGKLISVDNQVDVTTGTVRFRGGFDNSEGLLFPNQFVNAKLLVDTLHNQLSVPSAAIQRGAPGTFVYVVAEDGTVRVQPVKLGPTDGGNVAVLDGLQPGAKVVTDGADRLRDGAQVTVGTPGQAGAGNAQAAPGGDQPARGGRGERRRRE